MKKFFSIVIAFAILLSCCACGKTGGTEDTATGLDPLSPEAMYGHIDQTQPIDGVYKIWNAEGVKNIANHPEAKFELLCTIDMQGATLSPIGTADAPFTGDLKGGNFYLKNFTVQGGEETAFGFIGVNQGTVRNLVLENVTFIPGANAKDIGALVGKNEGKLTRCTVGGSLTVENALEGTSCGNVVGTNSGEISNTVSTVDVSYNAAASAVLGGIAGTVRGGTIEFVEASGALTTVGGNKTVGLFAGDAADAVFTNCVFAGPDNSVDGRLFVNFTGNADDDELAVAVNAKWRDNAYHAPLPENVLALRQRVVQEMYDLVTIEWKLREDFAHTCHCTGSVCNGVYSALYTYNGVPYNHGSSSLRRAQYCIGEDGYLKDWIYELPPYDGLQCYLGGDCSAILQQAWWTVSNSTSFNITRYMYPICGNGTIPVGDYKCDFELKNITINGVKTQWTQQYMDVNSEQVIYESYAALRLGDAIVNQAKDGGHTRLVAADPVIVKDQAGNIDPDYSYILMHQQGGGYNQSDETMIVTHGSVNSKFTFANLYYDWYIPITCEELLTGEMEPAEAVLENGADGYAGMLTGTVKTNYNLDFVTLKITDSKGNVVLDHPQFASVHKRNDYGSGSYIGRYMLTWMDMADFSAVLNETNFASGEEYTYTVTACMSTYDDIVVKEGSFILGA